MEDVMAGRRIRRALARVTVAALALATPAVLAAPSASAAAAAELFFSEYIEGSSNNKALEIYNGTGAAVDLGAGGYNVQMFFNGSASAGTTVNLTGTVADGDVFILADNDASAAILGETDQTSTASFFNGDDAVVLRKGETVIDVIGQIGVDPGSQWGSDLTSTADNTLRRLATVCAGDTDGSNAFDPAVEWDGFANDTFDGLGAHTSTCSSEPAGPVINEFVASTAGTDVEYVEILGSPGTDYSDYVVLEIEGDAGTAAGTIDEVITVGTTGANGLYLANLPANALENGTLTLLLVKDFTGALGDDLDTNNDGTLDVTPWSEMVDSVAVNDGGAGDLTYGVPTLGVSYDGLPFAPGGASRIPDGTDTDTAADWVRNDFDLAGIPGFTGTPEEGEALNTPGAPNALVEIEPPPPAVFKIHEVQGSGLSSPLSGQTVTVEAVVTAVKPGLNGYYLQEEDADADANPGTSEGLFVFSPPTVGQVAAGQLVRVAGTVGEFIGTNSSQTQLTNVTVTPLEPAVPLPTVTPVTFPVPSTAYLERFEGMRVELVDELVISEYFNYDRFGEVVLAKPLDGQDRLHTPTAVVDPGAPAQALAAEQALRIITLDDYFSGQNPTTIPHPGNGEPFSTANTFRGGDTVTGVVGVIDHTFGLYRIQPTAYGEYEAVNPRPTDAPAVGGSIQVASFNVLNYFLTLDQSGNRCGPLLNQDCRGADSQLEFDRQRVKIVEAIAALDADVVGLMEMENSSGVEPAEDLVEGLNDLVGAGTYAYIDTGVIGTDAIRLGFLYQPGKVTPVGDYAILDSTVDPRFDDTRNRPMLTQTFDEVATGARVTVSVNHLKSKGSACGPEDPDTGDGQGNCNLTRLAAAEAIADFLAGDPTDSGDPDHLVIGDLNSYDREDPIHALVEAGYTDLVKKFGGEFAYGYVFDGKVGYLDHALSNESLTPQVTGASEWHINADEPDILDYNLDFGRPDTFFTPDQYRSSDHDPVLIGLNLNAAPTVEASFGEGFLQCGADNATLTIDITDPNADDTHTVTVDWGDGSEPTIVGTDERTVTLTHTYAEVGTYTATVTVMDSLGLMAETTAETIVAYDTDGITAPFRNGEWTARGNSTVPVKVEFFECDGSEPTDLDPTVTVTQGDTVVLEATMAYVDGQWQYNLRTRDLAPGEYTVTITVAETGQTVIGSLTVRR
jgi:predicted extracellular nuclease